MRICSAKCHLKTKARAVRRVSPTIVTRGLWCWWVSELGSCRLWLCVSVGFSILEIYCYKKLYNAPSLRQPWPTAHSDGVQCSSIQVNFFVHTEDTDQNSDLEEEWTHGQHIDPFLSYFGEIFLELPSFASITCQLESRGILSLAKREKNCSNRSY